jgi:hypothetical protein
METGIIFFVRTIDHTIDNITIATRACLSITILYDKFYLFIVPVPIYTVRIETPVTEATVWETVASEF